MIDPFNITDYTRTDAQLEEFLLFGILVAANHAPTVAKKLDAMLSEINGHSQPFAALARYRKKHGSLLPLLAKHPVRFFRQKSLFLEDLLDKQANLNLRTATPAQLETVKGVAEKTSRFFILHSRPHARVAALDTHVLSFLTDLGYLEPGEPRPKGARYRYLQDVFLTLADESGQTPAAFDLSIWKTYRVLKKEVPA
jgi:thermostable 8-oxoguanine DNA glycosylase